MDGIARRQAERHPETNRGREIRVVPLREQMAGGSRDGVLLLSAGTAVLLLIASANVAALLLARGVARRREVAIRAALGAPRWRIARQFFVEAAVLAACAGLLGVLFAAWAVELARPWMPPDLPLLQEMELNATVLVSALAGAVFTACVTGVAPALSSARAEGRAADRVRWTRRGAGRIAFPSGRRSRLGRSGACARPAPGRGAAGPERVARRRGRDRVQPGRPADDDRLAAEQQVRLGPQRRLRARRDRRGAVAPVDPRRGGGAGRSAGGRELRFRRLGRRRRVRARGRRRGPDLSHPRGEPGLLRHPGDSDRGQPAVRCARRGGRARVSAQRSGQQLLRGTLLAGGAIRWGDGSVSGRTGRTG